MKQMDYNVLSFLDQKYGSRLLREPKLLGQGAYHENYLLELKDGDVRRYVIRINNGSQVELTPSEQLFYEFRVLLTLMPTGRVPAPVSLHYLEDKCLIIEEYISGRELDYQLDIPLVASTLAIIHNEKPKIWSKLKVVYDPLYSISTAALKVLEQLETMLNEEEQELSNYLKKICRKLFTEDFECCGFGIVHTDLNAGNIIIRDNQAFIIDWEAARYSCIEWDMAHFLAKTTTMWHETSQCILGQKEKEQFLYKYAAEYGHISIDQLVSNVNKFMKAIYLKCMIWCLEYKYKNINKNKKTFSKVERYLKHDFYSTLLTLC